jgi:hypothetical protein
VLIRPVSCNRLNELGLHRHGTATGAPPQPFTVIARALVSAQDRPHEAWYMLRSLTDRPGPITVPLASACGMVGPKAGKAAEAVAVLERCLHQPDLAPADRRSLHFGAAGLLDKLGRYDDAFAHARQGNELGRRLFRPFDPVAQAASTSRRIAYATPERLRAMPRATHGNRRPAFIVGMPRSGTSLVEQILASHPAVFGAGELPTLGQIAVSIARADWDEGDPYPQCLESLSIRRANRLAAQYLSHIESLNRNATYVTDKMPLNGSLLGLVELLFPGCHVIHCVRDPLDTCLSCYLTGFQEGNAFTADLAHLGAYYRDYQRLVGHWKSVVELPILDVRYEDLVQNPAPQVRRMLDFLNLPWDDRCLKFHDNPRPVHTASRDQVRRPMYRSSIGRWRNYEKHLGPLIAALDNGPAEPSRLAS